MKILALKLSTCLTCMLLIAGTSLRSQALTNEDIKTQMVKEWERAKTYTLDYLETMPADKYSFKAVDSIRSFAQQMLHIAQGNWFLMSSALGQQMPNLGGDLEKSAGAQAKDSVKYYIIKSYDYCIDAVKNSDLSKWGEKRNLFGFNETEYSLMIKTFEHQTHHRGQTTIYIRLQGIRPPEEQLFQL